MEKDCKWLVLLLLGLCTVSDSVLAQTVRVAADGSGDFTTVQAAVDTVEADDSTEPNVVMVASGTYPDTSVTISQEISIIGEDPANRAILVMVAVPGDSQGDAMVSTNGVSISIENLILIPSTTSPPDRAIRFDPVLDSDVYTVNISNVLISANNGSDQPLSVDGLESLFPGPDSSISFNDDGIRVLGGPFGGPGNADVTINIDHTVVTHIDNDRDPSQPTSGLDGFVLGGFNTTINFGPGVVASYCGRYGAQIITTAGEVVDFTPVLNCNGTLEEPVVFKDCGSVGLQLWTGTHDLNFVHLDENPVGIRVDMFSNRIDSDHLLVTENEDGIAWLNAAPPVGTTYDFENSTFYFNERDLQYLTGIDADTTAVPGLSSVVFENSIFLSSLLLFETDTPLELANQYQSKFELEYINVAFPDEGEFSVFPEFELYPVAANLENIITSDPEILSTDPNSPDYLVVSNEAYRTAGQEGSPLGGFYPFNNEPTDVAGWMMY